jgi:hypothetical protein
MEVPGEVTERKSGRDIAIGASGVDGQSLRTWISRLQSNVRKGEKDLRAIVILLVRRPTLDMPKGLPHTLILNVVPD